MKGMRIFGFAVAVAAAGVFAVYLGMCLGNGDGEKQAIAAWVQAVGSIAAIGIAIYVPWRQGQNDEKNRENERREQYRLLHLEAERAGQDVYWFLKALKSAVEGTDGRWPDVAYRLNELEFQELLMRITWCRQRTSDEGALSDLARIRNALAQCAEVVRHHPQPPLTLPEAEKELVTAHVQAAEAAWSSLALRERMMKPESDRRQSSRA